MTRTNETNDEGHVVGDGGEVGVRVAREYHLNPTLLELRNDNAAEPML